MIENGEIDMRTVSPTRRAAIVNWLYLRPKIAIYKTTTDEEIEDLWRDRSIASQVVRVKVEVM